MVRWGRQSIELEGAQRRARHGGKGIRLFMTGESTSRGNLTDDPGRAEDCDYGADSLGKNKGHRQACIVADFEAWT